MISSVIEFLAMLNPFALFLYLEPLRKELNHQQFTRVVLQASIISFLICLSFAYFGEAIFTQIFRINFESFRIFGGIIIFSYAYFFIVKGEKAMIIMKENLEDLASEIALPFMVGAGVISLSILMARQHSFMHSSVALFFIYGGNFLVIILMKLLRDAIETRKFKTAFDKNMEILLRINGFFIGSIGIDLIQRGIKNLFF